jgi:hypothetical protein
MAGGDSDSDDGRGMMHREQARAHIVRHIGWWEGGGGAASQYIEV